MIVKICLENFQSHEKTELEVGKFTVLTGGSNSGKSSVLRALAGLLRNDSAGDYITHGHKRLKVSLTLDTGETVEWIKGEGTNQYNIIRANGDLEEFQKVGTDVPEEVAELLGITPITMEGGQKFHLNVQEQLEPPFLVSKEHTAGFAAKIFGEITSAAKIQAATNEANRTTRSDNLSVKTRKEDRNSLNDELENYSFLDLTATSVEYLQSYLESLRDTHSQIQTCESIASKYSDCISNHDTLVPTVKALESASNVDLEILEKDSTTLQTLLEVQDSRTLGFEKESKIKRALEIINEALKADTDTLEETFKTLSQLTALKEQLDANNQKYEDLLNTSTDLADTVSEIEKEINSLYEQLDDCPVCGQDLSEVAKGHLLAEIRVY